MKPSAKLVDSKAIDKEYRTVMLNYRNGINKGLYKNHVEDGDLDHRLLPLLEAVRSGRSASRRGRPLLPWRSEPHRRRRFRRLPAGPAESVETRMAGA